MKKGFFFIPLLLLFSCNKETLDYQTIRGSAFGTTFHITYKDDLNRDFTKQIDSLVYLVNKSLSTYMPNSDISKINKGNETIVVDELFKEVFIKSERIYTETKGSFDPTIGVLVNAWGFGPKRAIKNLDSLKIRELLAFVGFNKVKLQDNKITKEQKEIYFDFNALAKGAGIDYIGRFLEVNNCKNYRIELGGEVRARGIDPNGVFWRIWLDEPNTDGTRTINKYIRLENQSLASSGNYRKFKINKNGHKYVHTINTKTGYAIASDLLAATVVNNGDCADVDGYATAFMAMGFEKSKAFLEKHLELKAYLIYVDHNGETQTFTSEGLLVAHR